jgi:hypothetical protein
VLILTITDEHMEHDHPRHDKIQMTTCANLSMMGPWSERPVSTSLVTANCAISAYDCHSPTTASLRHSSICVYHLRIRLPDPSHASL